MGTVIQNDSKKREAITTEEKENFLVFVRADNHYKQYYDAFCLLFATGLRISEFCGLTTRDLDFKNKVIWKSQWEAVASLFYVMMHHNEAGCLLDKSS